MALYLQEKTRIIGMHPNRRSFARAITDYARALDARGADAPFRNVGVWEFVGMTGDWARVLGLYEFVDGWASFADMVGQTMRAPAAELAATYRAVEGMRSGGDDEMLESLPGSPLRAELAGVGGALLVIDEARVPAGSEEEYGAALIERALPIAREQGRALIGLYKGALSDGLVVAYWASGIADYAAFNASRYYAEWRAIGRARRTSWREELWTAAPGSAFADASIDYGERDIRA